MRVLLAICCATLVADSAHAQKQERSLIDRLLRPDMTLKNEAQGKKFVTRTAPDPKSKGIGTFYVQPRAPEKNISAAKSISTTRLHPVSFNGGTQAAALPKNQSLRSTKILTTSSPVEIRETADNHKKVDARTFTGEHPFLVQGKSQKALDRRNPSLTVEQVRELLNKNK